MQTKVTIVICRKYLVWKSVNNKCTKYTKNTPTPNTSSNIPPYNQNIKGDSTIYATPYFSPVYKGQNLKTKNQIQKYKNNIFQMRYIDKYPKCKGCPVYDFCGTMVSSTRLCNSYGNEEEQKDIEQDILNEIGVVDPYDCC